MASSSIIRYYRIVRVLFCVISFCLVPTVNRALGTLENTATSNLKIPYANNVAFHADGNDDRKKQDQYLYNDNVYNWNGFFSNDEKMHNDMIQEKSEVKGKSTKISTKSKSQRPKFGVRGSCSKKYKRKRHNNKSNYDLYTQLLEEWQPKNGLMAAQHRHDEENICVDECSPLPDIPHIPNFIPTKLPCGCAKSPGNSQVEEVICTNITKVPTFSPDDRRINTLRFHKTKITSFNAEDSCNLPPRTNTLVFDQSPLKSFNGSNIHCRNVETIILEKSKITRWSLFLFSPNASSVRFLSLRSNEISYLNHTVSGNFTNLFRGNEANLPFPWDTTLPSLETLILNDNSLFKLPGGLFYPIRKSPVKNLLLRNCSLHEFCGHPLEYTENLYALDISENKHFGAENLAALLQPLNGRNLSSLHATLNEYPAPPFDALQIVANSLIRLYLNYSSLQSLDNTSFPAMPGLKCLALGNSQIHTITDDTFAGMTSLENIFLEGNMLKTIPPAALLPTLKILRFDDQHIDNGGTVQLDTVDFRKVNSLEYLSLNGIPIREIKEGTFLGLEKLRFLKLNGAEINRIDKKTFSSMMNLKELYMNDNYLENILTDTFVKLEKLEHLEIQNNCLGFMTFTLNSPAISSFLKFGKSNPLVAWLNGIKMRLKMVDSTIEADRIDINNVPFSVPFKNQFNLKYLDLSYNNIRYLFADLFVDMNSLKSINLNHNHIDEWDATLFENSKSLTQLFLYGNKIDKITEGMKKSFDNITYIDLRNNDFYCDCSLIYLNNSRFYKKDKYKCKDLSINNGNPYKEIMVYLEENDCESPSTNLLTMIVVPVLGCLTLLVLAVTGHRKRWYLMYVMHKFRNHSRKYQEEIKSSKYIYDTFVCYASSDRQWIFEQLLPKLEDHERLRVCVHERDFTVGQEITDNIVDSIDRSRKVIVVLSQAFVKSSWCMFELKIANSTTLKARESKLIFILLEHIHKDLMPKTLGLLLKTRTYIPWFLDIDKQKLFWARIKRAVAKPSESETQLEYTKL